jgi:hypothetical protein
MSESEKKPNEQVRELREALAELVDYVAYSPYCQHTPKLWKLIVAARALLEDSPQ